MVRLHIVTEGPTEENFVKDVLAPYLSRQEIFADAHSVTTRKDKRRNKTFRGGLDNLEHLLKDVRLWLAQEKNNRNCWVTTMVDLYAFPYNDREEWISEFEKKKVGLDKALFLEKKLHEEFQNAFHFIPHVQLHEYEALLLVNVDAVHNAFNNYHTLEALENLKNDIGTSAPEEINQGQDTAPSKRIIKYYPEYGDNKPVWGSLIAQEIGIDAMRRKCPHFNEWILKLENLGSYHLAHNQK